MARYQRPVLPVSRRRNFLLTPPSSPTPSCGSLTLPGLSPPFPCHIVSIGRVWKAVANMPFMLQINMSCNTHWAADGGKRSFQQNEASVKAVPRHVHPSTSTFCSASGKQWEWSRAFPAVRKTLNPCKPPSH